MQRHAVNCYRTTIVLKSCNCSWCGTVIVCHISQLRGKQFSICHHGVVKKHKALTQLLEINTCKHSLMVIFVRSIHSMCYNIVTSIYIFYLENYQYFKVLIQEGGGEHEN